MFYQGTVMYFIIQISTYETRLSSHSSRYCYSRALATTDTPEGALEFFFHLKPPLARDDRNQAHSGLAAHGIGCTAASELVQVHSLTAYQLLSQI